ncbi:uncharacterized protein CTRU02_215338 [Colletotrichum truncatum]|uniref:Uncharacterized protein n=1 Tax=Colletotrichum truncatum TaxID=5467 RepID=A0ACC3YD05_COLTU|nr:uncharacterized protein CTRU02_13294 [Colletotrichum truncatum]KAF6783531.1 hypothetical protein CTRU02_13294 [Colletotrichum truncatum]
MLPVDKSEFPQLVKKCLCGQSIDLKPSKIRRHFAVRHCYCYDCKGVFTRHLHSTTKPSHRIGTYLVFPPQTNELPPVDTPVHSPRDSCDSSSDIKLSRLQTPGPTAESRNTPTRSGMFTIWCLIGDTDDSGETVPLYDPDLAPFCNVKLSLELASINFNPWVSQIKRWKEAKRFEGFMKRDDAHQQQIHQSLLTSLIATAFDASEASGAIRTWEEVKTGLKMRNLHAEFDLDPARGSLVLVLMDTGFPTKSAIGDQYDSIEEYLQVIGSGSDARTIAYPSRDERMVSEYKLQDIRALDDVAREQGTWRPTTCFGVGECALVGVKDIMKRAWSCSSVHVVRSGEHASKLTCHQPKRRRNGKQKTTATIAGEDDDEGVWFHQEYVEMLSRMELRVFIATRPDPNGLRGLRGEVIRVCLTELGRKEGIIATEALDDTYESLGITREAAYAFSLGVFEALRDPRFGWSARFESLEVGCRLDISIRENGGPLFVNEITRWNGSHYFSDYCTGEPHALICNAFAKSWARYVKAMGEGV